jgi:YD repeat-containing protein
VWTDGGVSVEFGMIPIGGEAIGPWGWVLRRDSWGFSVDASDGLWHIFSYGSNEGRRYRLTAIEDRNRCRIILTYEDGHLVEVTDSAGRTIRVKSAPNGRIAAIEALNAVSSGRWVTLVSYSYDDAGNLIGATDAAGHSFSYGYDDDHLLTRDEDRARLTFHFVYDRKRRCIESWGDYSGKRDPSLAEDLPRFLADGTTRAKGIHHCRFEYHDGGYSEVTDSTQVRRFFGTRHGTLSKSIEGSSVTTASYDDAGHILSRTDAMGGTTTYDRDARGRILRLQDPLGRVTTIGRDSMGLPVRIIDPAGGETVLTRDRFGNIEFEQDALGSITAYRRDTRGLVTEVVSPTGARTALEYDIQGNLKSLTLPNGATWRWTYSYLGEMLAEADPTGATTRYAYSPRGEITAIYDALGGVTRYVYDGEGRLTRFVDPRGSAYEFTFGGYHRLVCRKDPNGNTIRLAYNYEGELVEVRNERGAMQRLEYNTSGRLVGETTFDGRSYRYRIDQIGRPTQIKNSLGEKIELVYDLAGQLVSQKLADGSFETFEYDLCGRLIAARGQSAEIFLVRNAVGQIATETQIIGGKSHTVEVAYDPAGERAARASSLGYEERIERDAIGARVRTIFNGSHAIGHVTDVMGREVRRNLPDGGSIESEFDVLDRLSRRAAIRASKRHPGALAITKTPGLVEPEWLGSRATNTSTEKRYQYDWDSELAETFDERRGMTRYERDPLGQLLAVLPERAPVELFQYDPAGNLHAMSEGAEQRVYDPGNRLLRKGNTEYIWDREGRLCAQRNVDPITGSTAAWSYRWHASGLLASVTLPQGKVVEFAYDPFGRRVQKRVTEPAQAGTDRHIVSLTRFVWDGASLIHEIRSTAAADGDPIVEERSYCFDNDAPYEPLAHRDADGGWLHYINDGAGTPERLIDDAGEVVCAMERTAWGKTTAHGNTKAAYAFTAYVAWRSYFAGAEFGRSDGDG